MAVQFLDLDDFKPIDGLRGHEVGDEFACLLSQPDGHAQPGSLATELLDVIAAPLQVGGIEVRGWPSIGVALCPNDGDTALTLLWRADAAMYRARRGLPGYAFFDGQPDGAPPEAGGLH